MLDKMEGLYREEGGTRRLLAKERKACFQPGHLLTGEGLGEGTQGFYHADELSRAGQEFQMKGHLSG